MEELYKKIALRYINDFINSIGTIDTAYQLLDMGVTKEQLAELGFDAEDIEIAHTEWAFDHT